MRSTDPNRVARLIAMGATLGDPERPKTVIRTHSQETDAHQYQPDTTEEWMTSEQQRETARLRVALARIKAEVAQFEAKFPGDYCIDALVYIIKDIIANAEQSKNDAAG